MKTFPATNIHGSDTLLGAMTAKRKKAIKDSKKMAPKAKNAYTDPYTYYHITDELLQVFTNEFVRTRDFTEALVNRPLTFDPITVGRVVKDIQESLELAYGRKAIQSARWWDGTRFWVSAEPEDRETLERLLEDLRELCTQPQDSFTPLRRCASLR